jgi:AbrB family looped-hinge helix DNA binding protein
MHVTEKGQVTIPLPIRKALGITPVSEVEFSLEGDRAYLSKKRDVDAAAERLDAYRGVATASLSTDDILALTRS